MQTFYNPSKIRLPLLLALLRDMIDFNLKIKNTNKFRRAALFYLQHKTYTKLPKGTTEYYDHWDEELKRCVEGYTAEDGDYITGYHYFYLNYCPIYRSVQKEVKDRRTGGIKIVTVKDTTFPDFYDYDYFFFLGVDDAEYEGKHMVALKSRRKGYSYKCGAMCVRNYYFFAGSKSYVYASSKQYLTEDGIITKAWLYMDFIDENTAWSKKRTVSTTLHRRAGYKARDEYGNEMELGFKSEIIGVTLKDNPDTVRGKAAKLIIFEEAGSFSELGAAWLIARPSVELDGVATGMMIAFGTGGDKDSNFRTLKDMFYNPKGYNCIEFENIWDDIRTDKGCGFFIPQYTNLDTRDADGNRMYMDEDGNTLRDKSLGFIMDERRIVIEHATSQQAVDRYVAERACTPMEACLEFSGNIFPKKMLLEQLSRVRTNRQLLNLGLVGDLLFNGDGVLQWHIKPHGDIKIYPLGKDDDPTGSIVIWEHPVDNPEFGLYILGVDPYDHDKAGTNSLGSTFVWKRERLGDSYSRVIVAEYTGRPQTADEYYENVRKLALYYNGRVMYENERKGIFPYFTKMHSDYLLADQPDIINDIIANSTVLRRKGCHINKFIKDWGEGMIKEMLLEEYEPGKQNLTRIYSEPLLEELIAYNDKGNFDRVMALIQVMVYDQELYKVKAKARSEEIKKTALFDGPIFARDSYNTYGHIGQMNSFSENIFTFNNRA